MRWILTGKCFDIIIIAFDYIQLLAMPPEKYEVYAFLWLTDLRRRLSFQLGALSPSVEARNLTTHIQKTGE